MVLTVSTAALSPRGWLSRMLGATNGDDGALETSVERKAAVKILATFEGMVAVTCVLCFVIKTYLGRLLWSSRSGVATSM